MATEENQEREGRHQRDLAARLEAISNIVAAFPDTRYRERASSYFVRELEAIMPALRVTEEAEEIESPITSAPLNIPPITTTKIKSSPAFIEQTKLTATYFNQMAAAVMAVGGITPVVATFATGAAFSLRTVSVVIICIATSFALHLGARRFLKRLG